MQNPRFWPDERVGHVYTMGSTVKQNDMGYHQDITGLRAILDNTLARHESVPGVSVAIMRPQTSDAAAYGLDSDKHESFVPFMLASGVADKEHQIKMTAQTPMQFASLSKTVGACYALEVFDSLGWNPYEMTVNEALRKVYAMLGKNYDDEFHLITEKPGGANGSIEKDKEKNPDWAWA